MRCSEGKSEPKLTWNAPLVIWVIRREMPTRAGAPRTVLSAPAGRGFRAEVPFVFHPCVLLSKLDKKCRTGAGTLHTLFPTRENCRPARWGAAPCCGWVRDVLWLVPVASGN